MMSMAMMLVIMIKCSENEGEIHDKNDDEDYKMNTKIAGRHVRVPAGDGNVDDEANDGDYEDDSNDYNGSDD